MTDGDVRAKYSTEQLVAVGEMALRSLHDISNPLSAVFAEAQLLALEPLPEEYLAAANRIVEHCRRAVQAIRRVESAVLGAAEGNQGNEGNQ
jgi:nitrogen-specific signal transduction histidine kinase